MIIGVAIKIGDSIEIRLPKPNRHHHCFAHFHDVTGLAAPKTGLKTMGANQGFYTSSGKYLDRFQAMRHAKRCGQKLIKTDPDLKHAWKHPLFSEDLW